MPGQTKCCTSVTQNHLSKPEDLMLQNAAPFRKSAPGPPNISGKHVSCTAPATRNASLQILFKSPTAANVFETATEPLRFTHSWRSAESLAPATGKHILTAKSAPRMVCFVHFDFESRLNAVRFFNILTSKSAQAFFTFWLRNVLRGLERRSTTYTSHMLDYINLIHGHNMKMDLSATLCFDNVATPHWSGEELRFRWRFAWQCYGWFTVGPGVGKSRMQNQHWTASQRAKHLCWWCFAGRTSRISG